MVIRENKVLDNDKAFIINCGTICLKESGVVKAN